MGIVERTFDLGVRVVGVCRYLFKQGRLESALASQLLRSGTSVGANVSEAQHAESKRDFAHKLAIACKEARETMHWLKLIAASRVVPEKRIAGLLDEVSQIVRILNASILTAQGKRLKPKTGTENTQDSILKTQN